MSANLDLSIDDIIKNQAKAPRAKPSGPQRTSKNGNNSKQGRQPYDKSSASYLPTAAVKEVAMILISNLHFGVTEQDLKELFGQVGKVVSVSLNFNSKGESKGSGSVTFAKPQDALLAVQQYHGVTLDRRPMKLAMPVTPSARPVPISSRTGPPRQVVAESEKKRTTGSRNQNNNRQAKGAPKGRRSKQTRTPVSKEDLDAQMDTMYSAPAAESKAE